jgi:hypothetical protein
MTQKLPRHIAAHYSPHQAWELWLLLTQLADSLWDSFEQEFIEYCCDSPKDPTSPIVCPFD